MSKSLPRPGLCIFDLDGTLVDSLHDIADALNYCLVLLGLPRRPVEEFRYMVGEGVPTLCRRALGETHPHLAPRLGELVRPVYRTQMTHRTRPYPGVGALIRQLRDDGIRLSVLSNKPHDMTIRVVATFWSDNTFDAVYGYTEERHRKPSPHYVLRICDELRVGPADTWVIGDTPVDMAAALAAGAVPIAVTWGYRQQADLEAAGAARVVTEPGDLLR
jgi:phosphoglycolate phosphatase